MNFKWLLIGIVVLGILILVGSLTGANRKLFDMTLDGLRADQSKVVETQAQNEKWYESEIKKLNDEKDQLQKQRDNLHVEKVQLASERDALKGWINELQKKRDTVIVSDDPDRIIDDLRKLGIGSIRRR